MQLLATRTAASRQQKPSTGIAQHGAACAAPDHLAKQAQRGLPQLRVLRHTQRVPVGPALENLGNRGEEAPAAGLAAAALPGQPSSRGALCRCRLRRGLPAARCRPAIARMPKTAQRKSKVRAHPAIEAVACCLLGHHARHGGRLLERLKHILKGVGIRKG